ncbi:hypothetical protein F5888DRAFT_1636135 [Russula emetica]|nr:hypothetical protein F5888DRAFT_1636135 [Russula emetica]
MSDFIEDKGDRWEPLIKVHAETSQDHTLIDLQLPPHIRTVFRSTDANQKELIVKLVNMEGICRNNDPRMAPEIREGAVFSPIRADQWSCGKTLLWFLAKGDDDLKWFAKDLTNKNPAHQLSLIDWSAERLDMTPCDDGDMDYVDEEGGSKESKAQAKNGVGINQMSDSKADILLW